ncbi:MAG: aminotransferase class IV [Actinomycetes bacterium]
MTSMYFNGEYFSGNKISLPVFGHPWLRGDSAFETLRTDGTTINFYRRHVDRLRASLAALEFEVEDLEEVENIAVELVSRGKIAGVGRLRITCFSNGDLLLTHEAAKDVPPAVRLARYPIVRPAASLLLDIKNGSYAASAAAQRWAQKAGFDDALFFNEHGNAAEATFSNVGFFVDGQILTPPLDSACLPGIVRQVALEIFPDFHQADVTKAMVNRADGIFLLSSIREIQIVESIDGRRLETQPILAVMRDEFRTHARAHPNS